MTIISAIMRFGDLRNSVCAMNQGSFKKRKPRSTFLLARRIVLQHVFVVELRLIQLIGGENKAAFLLNFAAPRFKYGGDARFNTITDRIGCPAFAGTTFAFETNHSTMRGSCKATTFSVFCRCDKAVSASATQAKDRLVNASKALYSAWLCFRCCLFTVVQHARVRIGYKRPASAA